MGRGASLQGPRHGGKRPCSQGTGRIRDAMALVSGRKKQQKRLDSQDQSRRGLECQVQGSYFNCTFLFQ